MREGGSARLAATDVVLRSDRLASVDAAACARAIGLVTPVVDSRVLTLGSATLEMAARMCYRAIQAPLGVVRALMPLMLFCVCAQSLVP